MDKLTREFNEHNALMKRVGSKQKTFNEYMRYRSGNAKTTRASKPKKSLEATTYRHPSPQIPSGDTYDRFVATKKEMHYTGDKLVGIGIMHKSNLVPIFKVEDAEDLARMRR